LILDQTDQVVPRWRSRLAIVLATGVGIPIGVFLIAMAVPFGPVLLGWIAALISTVVATAVFCVLATDRFGWVSVGFAAGVALGVVVASVARNGIGDQWLGPPAQFIIMFGITLIPAGLTASLCALLKWEDKKAREK
jgi:uncharacterized membrane protein